MRIALLAAMVVLLTLPAHRGEAQQTGMVNAVAFEEVPSGAAIDVDPLDDSDDSLALLTEIERQLRDKGYEIREGAELVLSFELRDLEGAWTGGGTNSFLEFRNTDDHTGTDAPEVRLNLFKSDKGGLINRLGNERPEGTRQIASSELRLDATLDNRSNGKRLWQGWSVIDLGPSDNFERQKRMVPPLIETFGQTTRQKTFPLR